MRSNFKIDISDMVSPALIFNTFYSLSTRHCTVGLQSLFKVFTWSLLLSFVLNPKNKRASRSLLAHPPSRSSPQPSLFYPRSSVGAPPKGGRDLQPSHESTSHPTPTVRFSLRGVPGRGIRGPGIAARGPIKSGHYLGRPEPLSWGSLGHKGREDLVQYSKLAATRARAPGGREEVWEGGSPEPSEGGSRLPLPHWPAEPQCCEFYFSCPSRHGMKSPQKGRNLIPFRLRRTSAR